METIVWIINTATPTIGVADSVWQLVLELPQVAWNIIDIFIVPRLNYIIPWFVALSWSWLLINLIDTSFDKDSWLPPSGGGVKTQIPWLKKHKIPSSVDAIDLSHH
jgi:hypothetical protein